MKCAVIDVGSNSVRYALINDNTTIAQKEINSTVLADGLFFSGMLNDAAINRTVTAVAEFCNKARKANADKIYIFATEAVRAAKNGKEFTNAVYKTTGITVDVIDGETEALIGFMGASENLNKTSAVFDVGGASCEIICGKASKITYRKSSPVGCVRLRDGAALNREKAETIINSAITDNLPQIGELTGIGGTATALGAMLSCPNNYNPVAVHGTTVTKDFLLSIANRFFAGENLIKAYPSLTPNRASIIGYGALVSLSVLNKFSLNEFTVSERDNMEGYYCLKKCGIFSDTL